MWCGNQKPLCPASKASHDTTAVFAGELLAQAQFPALLLISLHAADTFQQVAPVDLTVPKMVISVCVGVWAAMLLTAILENKDTRTSLPVSSSMQINVLKHDLCAGTSVEEPTATRWGHGSPFQALHLVASSSVTVEVDKARAIGVNPLNEGGRTWLCAPY